MTTRSRRLFGPFRVPDTAASAFTVTDGRVYLCKAIRVVNTDTADHWVTLTINGDDGADAELWQAPVKAGRVFSDTVGFTLMPDDDVRMVADAPDVLTITCSGARLGPPT